MSLKTNITDTLKKYAARVIEVGSLQVVNTPITPELMDVYENEGYRHTLHNQLLDSVGDGTGTTNMNVDGSTTPQKFYLNACKNCDIFIKRIAILISSSTVSMDKFGNVNKLNSGIDLDIVERGQTTNIITDGKSGGSIFGQIGCPEYSLGAATVNEIIGYDGNNDAYVFIIPIEEFLPDGLRLARKSKDQIILTVNDNLTSLYEFNVRTIGYRIG